MEKKGCEEDGHQYVSNDLCYCPGPPCLASMRFRSVCESSFCCMKRIGPCGLPWFHRNRNGVMLFATFMSVISLILSIIACLSLGDGYNSTRDYRWAGGSLSVQVNGLTADLDFYAGLSGIAIEASPPVLGENMDTASDFIRWSDNDCNSNPGFGLTDECEECRDASEGYETTMIISCITLWPQISTDLTRRSTRGDINCQKAFGIATAMLGFITSIAALQTYKKACYDSIQTTQICNNGVCIEIEFELGLGFYCLLFATIFKLVDFSIHALTPTPPYRHFADTNTSYDPEQNMKEDVPTSLSVEDVHNQL